MFDPDTGLTAEQTADLLQEEVERVTTENTGLKKLLSEVKHLIDNADECKDFWSEAESLLEKGYESQIL